MICATVYSHNILQTQYCGLQDGGTYGLVDNLTYTYNGNQLTKISDSVEDPTYVGAFNFKDGADNSTEYTYDAVGNMTSDKNKGITSITYNDINQPQKITFSDGKTTEYVYSYDGTKLQTVHKTLQPQTSTTTTYCGNLIYENGALKQMLVDGGYVTFSGATPVYHFYIQDHLGNNRVVAKANGTVEQINHYYPYGGLMADICTGSDVQRYKYNGKELDRMHGLDWYDFGARWMDAALGRWHFMDPLCEKYYDISPYVYCGGNPVNAIDPDGRSIWTKIVKIGAKVGAKVSRYGWKELGNAATYADAVSDITDNVNTLFDGNASTMDRVVAGISLASEGLPVSLNDAGAFVNAVKKVGGKSKKNISVPKPKSMNQLQKDVERGKAPKEIDRFDRGGKYEKEQDHVHFKDGTALNKDGTIKEGDNIDITKKTRKYLEQNGWHFDKKD